MNPDSHGMAHTDLARIRSIATEFTEGSAKPHALTSPHFLADGKAFDALEHVHHRLYITTPLSSIRSWWHDYAGVVCYWDFKFNNMPTEVF